jgi:hypothetical protein
MSDMRRRNLVGLWAKWYTPNKTVATTAPTIIAVTLVAFLFFAFNSLWFLPDSSHNDSNDAPTTTQHTTTSVIEVGNVCEKTLAITIGFKETGLWNMNSPNPSSRFFVKDEFCLLVDVWLQSKPRKHITILGQVLLSMDAPQVLNLSYDILFSRISLLLMMFCYFSYAESFIGRMTPFT